jgi:hypothetical protein
MFDELPCELPTAAGGVRAAHLGRRQRPAHSAARDIAGISGGPRRNVVGLMPHPERASESILGRVDGRLLFEALLAA